VNALETGITSPKDSLEYGLGYSFSFFCKNAVSKSIGRERIVVEFFSAEGSILKYLFKRI
jgi:hypothetical protein